MMTYKRQSPDNSRALCVRESHILISAYKIELGMAAFISRPFSSVTVALLFILVLLELVRKFAGSANSLLQYIRTSTFVSSNCEF